MRENLAMMTLSQIITRRIEELIVKKILFFATMIVIAISVSACANLSSTSPDAVNCDPRTPTQDRNPDCMGGR
jgi:hypothetical protein